ncbi:hypothetical protein BJ875DRAFT_464746 [Amylocarpus encephaloides]|uniref:Transmembrane protein 53 n=1 Tax=Amylocarpus encephaloides TaxID=45428 RepID=A0A9P8C4H9_9HELO|nr:hypothetical protein BJ875DRAFT_464746 [Amylocarpus encephaloides]
MDARDVHIAKYIARYQALYPSASILLVKSFFRYYFIPESARREVDPAVSVVRNFISRPNNDKPKVLIHLFSNGGSCMLYHLYDVYAEAAQVSSRLHVQKEKKESGFPDDHLLPPHVTIFDSAPGRWAYTGSTQAVLVGLPAGLIRNLAFPLVHLFGLWWVIKYLLLKRPQETHIWGLAHNDPAKARETCRAYVYSEADEFVNYHDVDEHADHAERNGYVVMRREKFVDSQHVTHARFDPDRYWSLVEDAWEAGSQADSGRR